MDGRWQGARSLHVTRQLGNRRSGNLASDRNRQMRSAVAGHGRQRRQAGGLLGGGARGGRGGSFDRFDFSGGELICLRAHETDEAIIKGLGGIVAHLFEGEGERGDFDEAGDIATGAHEKFDVRQAHAEDFIVIFFQAGALFNRLRGPLSQGDHHVDAFLQADAFDAEHFADVDDADPPALHVTAVERAG